MGRPTPEKVGPGQESVWDYPRPPRLERTSKRIQVVFNGEMIADTTAGYRILETSHPPSYYVPPADVRMEFLTRTSRSSMCEWKGGAKYYTVQVGDKKAENAAWYYPTPVPAFGAIKDYVVFYAQMMDACYVAGEQVRPQPGGFYGGWITSDVVGPFKGVPGSWGW